MQEQDVQDLFASFIRTGTQGEDIKQIYEVLPYLDHEQQRILTLYNALAKKHDSAVLQEISDSIVKYAKTNRKLGFHFRKLVEAMSLFKHFKGFKANTNMGDSKE